MSDISPKEFMARIKAGNPEPMFRAWPSPWFPLFVYPASWRGFLLLILLSIVAPAIFFAVGILVGALWVGAIAAGISIIVLGFVIRLDISDARMHRVFNIYSPCALAATFSGVRPAIL